MITCLLRWNAWRLRPVLQMWFRRGSRKTDTRCHNNSRSQGNKMQSYRRNVSAFQGANIGTKSIKIAFPKPLQVVFMKSPSSQLIKKHTKWPTYIVSINRDSQWSRRQVAAFFLKFVANAFPLSLGVWRCVGVFARGCFADCSLEFPTLHSTLYTLHSTLNTMHSALHTPQFKLHTPHSSLLDSTLHTLHFRLHAPLHTLYMYAQYSKLYTSHCTIYTSLYTPHSRLHTLHSKL